MQGRLVEVLRGSVHRGRIEALVTVQSDQRDQRQVTLDEALLARYYEALQKVRGRFRLAGTVTLDHLLALPQIVSVTEGRPQTEARWGLVRQTLEAAVGELVQSRRREGAKLVEDVRGRVKDIERNLRAVKARLPEALKQQRQETRARLQELLGTKGGSSVGQLEEAVALIKESDVHEELVRLESHLAHLQQTLTTGGLMGKRLDFIAQELMREANTLGAKVNDALAARHVVDIKGAIERIREQVQNLE